ncbi:hypothetical protein [Sphingomonas sanxanigenens]|uniref:Uncharacterized protein n=1 Tax=Sphingomonas sanxanigenens DSM 19645 = NX02 TaxID=1123269 RepID=W0A3X5_9SPHN|nr:hypothetical protein [Sphingomonas sanxanigenens]AHE52654.1 hypothetical protein NX02_04555 [Sphingomonas sanxanigenens DSM 19645 = NX02]
MSDTPSLITALQSGDTSPETIARVIERLRELEKRCDVMKQLAEVLVRVAG